MGKRAALHNLGCKVNAYETEAMEQLLADAGYEIVPFEEEADVYIVNTCTVTNMADRKSRQMLHRAKKRNPAAAVVAVGCYAQAAGEELCADEAVDLVIGNNRKKDLLSLLESFRAGQQEAAISDISCTREYEELEISGAGRRTRAYVKVQDGCNQFCSYCIIPYTRGRVRSREKEQVLEEIRRLAENGYREVVLAGIHLSSYGLDLEDEDLLQLIEAVHETEGIERIRLGSLEPGIITEEFAAALARLPKLCPHFHLSLQSGCTATLKRMNRRYTAGEYEKRCQILRQAFADPALTTDVIVGFPGETEAEFQETLAFLRGISFYETHIFKYSQRKGTRAAGMPDQVPEPVKAERSRVLLELNEENKRAYQSLFCGKEREVLFEDTVEFEGKTCWMGHTAEYLEVLCFGEEDLSNRLQRVRIKEILSNGMLLGEKQFDPE